MSVIAVIPARYGSTRLPAKALAEIGGVPMVVRVWKQVSKARLLARVIVATDDERIAEPVRAAGGEAMMTSPAHASGTDRVAEVARRLEAQAYLNVQGDLPFIDPADVDALARLMLSEPSIAMATLATPIADLEEFRNPNVVKVVCNRGFDAIYFSRSPIPFARDIEGVPPGALRHIGVYAYRRDFLLEFAAMEAGYLERIEKLEQLRALENRRPIRILISAAAPPIEVDTAEDLARAVRAQRTGASEGGRI